MIAAGAAEVDLRSTSLPIVTIDTNGLTVPDEPKIAGRMTIIASDDGSRNRLTDPPNDYSGLIGIEIRGQTSQGFPKKQYSLETRDVDGENDNVSLLGLPEENDWILHGPYSDKTMMRNALAYTIASQTGHYAPRFRFCELVLNDRYEGVYLLMEKIKRDRDRVDIASSSTSDLSGGYLLEKSSWNKISEDDVYVVPERAGEPFVIKYPKGNDLTTGHLDWIVGYLDDCEESIFGDSYQDPVLGYAAFFDIPALMDYLLVNELFRNQDAFHASTFMHKDRDGKMILGPVWDLNVAMGNNLCDHPSRQPQGWTIAYKMWARRLLSDPAFATRYQERYRELRRTVFSPEYLDLHLDQWAAQIEEAQARNFIRWDILGQEIWPNCFVGDSFRQEIRFLKDWLHQRIAWLDDQWNFAPLHEPVVTEINYHSAESADAGDWLELYNPWYESIDLGGWSLSSDGTIIKTFTAGTRLSSMRYLVVSGNPAAFQGQFPDVHSWAGDIGFDLNDFGGRIRLIKPDGEVVQTVDFQAGDPWPLAAAGQGATLERRDPFTPEQGSVNWLASLGHGTPGQINQTRYQVYSTVAAWTATRPNPSSLTMTMEFSLQRDAAVELAVFDVRGRHVVTFFKGDLKRGPHAITWIGTDERGVKVPSGVYVGVLRSEDDVVTRKLQVIR